MTSLPPVVKVNDTRNNFPPIVKINNKVFKVKG
ncbi:hypothetical protein UFOVP694_64 [uncultured Caudovirales phage]|jgi:hypothetical protein|uniref:Uncharacterized protein n=1 Tax=uncultured Caudovirales phage TaxID=2100421 RepID=A0A6J5NLB6_9CAUD|nr:hypothetical protein UFOVP694_64 [uncultured Caudovirales phage]